MWSLGSASLVVSGQHGGRDDDAPREVVECGEGFVPAVASVQIPCVCLHCHICGRRKPMALEV